jgi:hypothetical protein
MGNIKPIYKNKGDKMDPKNYRPITILSCLGKLFTTVLSERLTKYSDDLEKILTYNHYKKYKILYHYTYLQLYYTYYHSCYLRVTCTRGKLPRNLNLSLNGEKLEIVNSLNYLGIELSRTGNFKRAKQSIAGKGVYLWKKP